MDTMTIQPDESLIFSNGVFTYKKGALDKTEFSIGLLLEIAIITTDQGPFMDDVAMAFFFQETVLFLPSGHKCYQNVYDAVSDRLPLDYKEIIKAIGCAENAVFSIWKKNM